MTNMHYDTIIIGSGQGGTPLAKACANAKRKTALIEKEHIGGCCVNDGCTPTKTLIASGRAAYLTRRGPDYGVHMIGERGGANEVMIDMAKVRQRKRDIVNSFRAGSENRLKVAGVYVLRGEASFVDAKTLKVVMQDGSEKVVTGDNIVINTGCRPAVPKLDGIEKVDKDRVLDSTSIQELDKVPGHLVVVGGGYVGVEFGQLFQRLGSKVTILHRGAQLLPREDKDMADMLRDILKEDGLDIRLQSSPSKVSSTSSDSFSIEVKTKDGSQTLPGVTHILFAAGRIPNTENLNTEAASVETDAKGYIVCNKFLQTNARSIYVMGDVKGPPAFTHISYDDHRILKSVLLSLPSDPERSTQNRLVPYVVYTDPQFGHVGLHEHEARSKHSERKILTATMPMAYVARARETDETRGAMKAVVDGESGTILGFTCLGTEGGELMSLVEVAMMAGLPYTRLQDAVFAHPAFAESLNNLWGFLK